MKNTSKNKKIIVISASSDIGTALCLHWKKMGYEVFGTYRTESKNTKLLRKQQVQLLLCDLKDKKNIQETALKFSQICHGWDGLILCPGTQKPVGPFINCNFDDWQDSINVNFSHQVHFVHSLLPYRNAKNENGSCVLFFAGGGTNNATINYSAYTISKIALIKMCELLDAEVQDTRFSIVGPGWVKTKIHQETFDAREKAGSNYQKTRQKLSSDELTPMEDVIECCDWVLNSPRQIVSGRNFSVVFDQWKNKELFTELTRDENMYKLRRYKNNWLIKIQTGHAYETI